MENVDLKKLRGAMPVGWRSLIANEKSVTLRYVDQVMKGTRFNIDILLLAVEMASKYQEDLNYIRQKVQDLN